MNSKSRIQSIRLFWSCGSATLSTITYLVDIRPYARDHSGGGFVRIGLDAHKSGCNKLNVRSPLLDIQRTYQLFQSLVGLRFLPIVT
eukprot:scaffold174999_cov52-Attheya_sp.AAC.1